ncbi:hypothetical protein DNTS_017187 [Danionella cerebrum]|uniref:non-specific serine/threonine protein kinase n=1 Tax=Danionella cerebrum TaxID=2873325 RepID=A0A553QBX2_9TELE|nr:hypothetical protein DNTS_017187 [Danionella translucida]
MDPRSDGKTDGVYVNTYGRITKDVVLQWGEMPTSVAYILSNQIMGWGEKAIEIRSVETGHLDGVFMHKRAQRLKFLCLLCLCSVWGIQSDVLHDSGTNLPTQLVISSPDQMITEMSQLP